MLGIIGSVSEYPDVPITGPVRGRGAGLNPGNRHEGVRLHVLGDVLDEQLIETPDGRQVKTRVLPDRSRSIINKVDSPDLNLKWTINPYRGCEHGCIYCYARPTHENLGFSCGIDFETRIMAKVDAPQLLKRELSKRSWIGEGIAMSGVTDPYQPTERKLQITRQILEIFCECRQPVAIVTKNRLVTRDIDLLSELARRDAGKVAISLTTLDPELARVMEPRASRPADRLAAMQELTDAGIPVAVMVAPVIPGLTDHEMPRLLEAAANAGAVSAGWVMLRLPHQVKALFVEWLHRHFPDRAERVQNRLKEMHNDKLYDATPGHRRRGRGEIAQQIKNSFDLFSRRYKLDQPTTPLSSNHFQRPAMDGQLGLFEH